MIIMYQLLNASSFSNITMVTMYVQSNCSLSFFIAN